MTQIQLSLPGTESFNRPQPAASPILCEATSIYRVAHNLDGCSVLDLLAAIIGGRDGEKVARDLASKYDLGQLGRASAHELAQLGGIGAAIAIRLMATLELGRRAMRPPETRVTIRSPADAAGVLLPRLSSLGQEHFIVVGLDTRNQVRFVETLYVGNVNSSIIRAAEVFGRAVREVLPAIIIAHNHPSGHVEPSPEDVAATRSICEAGKLLDVDVLDHIIVGHGEYISLKERGLFP